MNDRGSTHESDSYLVSIYYEAWSEEDREAGEGADRGVTVDRELVDSDDLARYGRDFSFTEASGRLEGDNQIWFRSTTPAEDREYFENGISTYYSLHVHEVNGRLPSAEDYQRIAGWLGISLETGKELEASGIADKQPGDELQTRSRGLEP